MVAAFFGFHSVHWLLHSCVTGEKPVTLCCSMSILSIGKSIHQNGSRFRGLVRVSFDWVANLDSGVVPFIHHWCARSLSLTHLVIGFPFS